MGNKLGLTPQEQASYLPPYERMLTEKSPDFSHYFEFLHYATSHFKTEKNLHKFLVVSTKSALKNEQAPIELRLRALWFLKDCMKTLDEPLVNFVQRKLLVRLEKILFSPAEKGLSGLFAPEISKMGSEDQLRRLVLECLFQWGSSLERINVEYSKTWLRIKNTSNISQERIALLSMYSLPQHKNSDQQKNVFLRPEEAERKSTVSLKSLRQRTLQILLKEKVEDTLVCSIVRAFTMRAKDPLADSVEDLDFFEGLQVVCAGGKVDKDALYPFLVHQFRNEPAMLSQALELLEKHKRSFLVSQKSSEKRIDSTPLSPEFRVGQRNNDAAYLMTSPTISTCSLYGERMSSEDRGAHLHNLMTLKEKRIQNLVTDHFLERKEAEVLAELEFAPQVQGLRLGYASRNRYSALQVQNENLNINSINLKLESRIESNTEKGLKLASRESLLQSARSLGPLSRQQSNFTLAPASQAQLTTEKLRLLSSQHQFPSLSTNSEFSFVKKPELLKSELSPIKGLCNDPNDINVSAFDDLYPQETKAPPVIPANPNKHSILKRMQSPGQKFVDNMYSNIDRVLRRGRQAYA